jgi:hypothetical protein
VLQVGNFCSRSSCRDGPARRSVNQPSTDKSIFYRFPKAGQHRKQSERRLSLFLIRRLCRIFLMIEVGAATTIDAERGDREDIEDADIDVGDNDAGAERSASNLAQLASD